MKKVLCFVLMAVMVLTLASCGHKHAFGEWTTVTEATCTAEGLRERVCECGEKETEAVPAGHKYGDPVAVGDFTCENGGTVEKTCTVCSEKVTETLAATGHDFAPASDFAPKTCKTCGLTEGEALSKVVATGETFEDTDHKFTVESIEFSSELKERRGNITYSYSQKDYVLAIKLKFTNLSTTEFSRWNSDRVQNCSLEYGGKYKYEGEYWCPADDIVALGEDSVYIVYEVPKSMKEDTESSIYAKFEIDGTVYSAVIQKGSAVADTGASSENSDVTADIKVGDVRSDGEKFSFTFKDMYYTSKPSEKNGNITHSYGSDGKYYLAMKLEFTNLDSESFGSWGDDRFSDMKMSFAGQYDYEGKMWCPGNEIVPLASGSVYVLFEVPETVEDSADALTASFTVDGTTFNVDCRTAK